MSSRACSIFYLKGRSPLCYGPYLSHYVFLLFRHTQRSCPLLSFPYLVVPIVKRIAHVLNSFLSPESACLRLLFPSSWLSCIFSSLLLVNFRLSYPRHPPYRQLLLQQCQQLAVSNLNSTMNSTTIPAASIPNLGSSMAVSREVTQLFPLYGSLDSMPMYYS